MRTVIEAGRKSSPLIGEGLNGLQSRLSSFDTLLMDLSSVKSESGREAMLDECRRSLGGISEALASTITEWTKFSSLLGDYKYQFGKRKKGPPPDCPGQQVMNLGCENTTASEGGVPSGDKER